MPHVLVLDDDTRLRRLLHKYLSENGFTVSTAADAPAAREVLDIFTADALVVDVMMPGETGVEFTRKLREKSATPVLMLTAMNEPPDRITGLESGADDYLAKPFEPKELLLRLHNILKRAKENAEKSAPEEIRMGDCLYDVRRSVLAKGEARIHLAPVEAALLKILAEVPGRALSREDLAKQTGASANPRTIDVQITRLRRKIEPDIKFPRYIQTVRGTGYALIPD